MIINCNNCNTKVAEIVTGSKIKKGAVMLCDDCEKSRTNLKNLYKVMGCSQSTTNHNDFFKDIFSK